MPRYRHYKNLGEGEQIVFFTSTVLGFERIFASERIASVMAGSLLDDCRFYKSALFAFVVMPHHIHFLCRLPEAHDSSWLMNRVKSNSAKRILPRLSHEVRDKLQELGEKHERALWQQSFRAFPIISEPELMQKIEYIHENPVRSQLVADARDYKWSSASLYVTNDALSWNHGIDVSPTTFCSAEDLVIFSGAQDERASALNPRAG